MQETLHKRRRMAVVRLEAANSLSKEMEKYFCEKFNIRPECIFRTKMPMKLDFIFAIADKLPDSKKKTLVDVPSADQRSINRPGSSDDQDHNLPSGEESTTCRISLRSG